MKINQLVSRIADEIDEPVYVVSKVFRCLNAHTLREFYKWLKITLAVVLLAIVLNGCVATTPAFGGKTRAETSFIDTDGTSYTRE